MLNLWKSPEKKIANPTVASKYVFQELYDSTQTVAKQIAEKDKFELQGTLLCSIRISNKA